MKHKLAIVKCRKCRSCMGYELMTVNTSMTQAVLFLNCGNCREKNIVAVTGDKPQNPNQLKLFNDGE